MCILAFPGKHRVVNNNAIYFLLCINYLEYVNWHVCVCVCVKVVFAEIYAHFHQLLMKNIFFDSFFDFVCYFKEELLMGNVTLLSWNICRLVSSFYSSNNSQHSIKVPYKPNCRLTYLFKCRCEEEAKRSSAKNLIRIDSPSQGVWMWRGSLVIIKIEAPYIIWSWIFKCYTIYKHFPINEKFLRFLRYFQSTN